MILRILKSNNFANLFFIPFAVFAFWAEKIFAPFVYPFAPGEPLNVLYKPIFSFTGDAPLLSVILSALLVVILSILIEFIIARYQFIRIKTRLPAILFVLLVGGLIQLHSLHPVYFAAVFLLFSIYRLFGIFEQAKAYNIIFDVGFLFGIASLFYVNLVTVLPAFLIGVSILSHRTGWREHVILILGFLLPFVFATGYYFYTDQLNEVITLLIDFITQRIGTLKGNLFLQIYLGTLVLLTIVASIDIARHYDTKKVSSRKYFFVFFFLFLFSIASFVLVPATSQEMLIITAIPITFLLSNFFVFLKSKFWGELFFFFLLAVVVAIQFFG